DALEVEELGDAFVERAAQLRVDLGRHGRALDLPESEACEELALERQDEHALDAQLAHGLDQALDDQAPDAPPASRWVEGERADLGDVLPQRVHGAAAADAAPGVRDPEVLHVLVELDALLREQDAIVRIQLDEIVDGGHVRRAGTANGDLAHVRLRSQIRMRAVSTLPA